MTVTHITLSGYIYVVIGRISLWFFNNILINEYSRIALGGIIHLYLHHYSGVNMILRVLTLLCIVMLYAAPQAHAAADGAHIFGAGASFPKNVYMKWIMSYYLNNRVVVNYKSIGSGGGLREIKNGRVDFGASDAPLSNQELKKQGLVQFPMVLGGIVPAFNLPGIENNSLRLDGGTLADIFRGEITRWNDRRIIALNSEIKNLPDLPIHVVTRHKKSGTTWIFSHYLSKVSNKFNDQVGEGSMLQWPVGRTAKGSGGMVNMIKKMPGAIGYVEYSYAKMNAMTYPLLRNRNGRFVIATGQNFARAAAQVNWSKDGAHEELINANGGSSWPITGVSYILMQQQQQDAAKAEQIFDFFDWCLREGRESAAIMGMVALPASVSDHVREKWSTIRLADGSPAALY